MLSIVFNVSVCLSVRVCVCVCMCVCIVSICVVISGGLMEIRSAIGIYSCAVIDI